MSHPLVSIVVPCFNHEGYILECLRSILSQTYENIELIVIDDGSSDNSVERIRCLASDCQARFTRFEFRNRENKGLCATLNEAIDWCQGKYLSILASDDIMLPQKTQMQVDKLESLASQGFVGVFSGVAEIDENGRSNRERAGKDRAYTFDDVFLRRAFLPAPSSMILMSSIKATDGYDEAFTIEDLFMWLKLTESGAKLYSMPEVLVLYRQHEGNFSKRAAKVWQGVMQVLKQYQGHRLYRMSVATSMIMQANIIVESDRGEAAKWVGRAAKVNMRALATRHMAKFTLRFLGKKV